jgi:chemotaxis protein methyltransferase CheR
MKEESTQEESCPSALCMSEREFSRLSSFIQKHYGIHVSIAKKYLLENRLRGRLRSLGLQSFTKYHEFLLSPQGEQNELPLMVNAITTNKTDFFREPHQFDYLTKHAVPEMMRQRGADAEKIFRIWSVACSSGEEPYTLAIVLSEFSRQHRGFNFNILATDISTKVLDCAQKGVYPHEQAEPIPILLRKKYLLRSKNSDLDLVRVVSQLQELIQFRYLNLMQADFGIPYAMDIIFCRNVIIYFDPPTQKMLVEHLCRQLAPGGYLFMGHSEVLNRMALPLKPVAPSIYKLIAA